MLYDLEDILTYKGATFLSALLDSGQEEYVVFGALLAGRLKIENLRSRIEGLLKSSNDESIKFHSIVGLGNLANPDSHQFIFSFLKHLSPAIRRAAIEAAGKIGGQEIVAPLKAAYTFETDIGHRIAIITSISRLSNKEAAKEVLQGFQSMESDPLLASILSRKVNEIGN